MTGEKAKPIMMASKLPLDALGKVGVQTQHVWCSVVSQSGCFVSLLRSGTSLILTKMGSWMSMGLQW